MFGPSRSTNEIDMSMNCNHVDVRKFRFITMLRHPRNNDLRQSFPLTSPLVLLRYIP